MEGCWAESPVRHTVRQVGCLRGSDESHPTDDRMTGVIQCAGNSAAVRSLSLVCHCASRSPPYVLDGHRIRRSAWTRSQVRLLVMKPRAASSYRNGLGARRRNENHAQIQSVSRWTKAFRNSAAFIAIVLVACTASTSNSIGLEEPPLPPFLLARPCPETIDSRPGCIQAVSVFLRRRMRLSRLWLDPPGIVMGRHSAWRNWKSRASNGAIC